MSFASKKDLNQRHGVSYQHTVKLLLDQNPNYFKP